jgi:hypothetical protein
MEENRRTTPSPILVNANIVLLAENHNPSIATKDWLQYKGIIREKPVDFANLPVLSRYESESFSLFVDPNRLILEAKNQRPETIEALPQIVRAYAEALPETGYSAIGLNFRWRIDGTEALNVAAETRRIFLNPESKVVELTEKPDFGLGVTLRFTEEGMNFQITIQPDPKQDNRLVLDFNCHQSLNMSIARLDFLKRLLDRFSLIYEKTEHLANQLYAIHIN